MHVDRLERRYLSGDERIQQGPAGGQPRAIVGLQATDNNDAPHWRVDGLRGVWPRTGSGRRSDSTI
jgi:hypothetical protein